MADRIAPYLRYYSSHRPTDDHGSRPIVLVVFEDEIVQTHFLRVARDEMARTGVRVPLRISHRSLLERMGTAGTGVERARLPGTRLCIRVTPANIAEFQHFD